MQETYNNNTIKTTELDDNTERTKKLVLEALDRFLKGETKEIKIYKGLRKSVIDEQSLSNLEKFKQEIEK